MLHARTELSEATRITGQVHMAKENKGVDVKSKLKSTDLCYKSKAKCIEIRLVESFFF